MQQLNREIGSIMNEPSVVSRFPSMGFELIPETPEEYGNMIRSDYERCGAVVRAYNI